MVSRNRSLLYSDVDGGKLDTDVSFQRAGGARGWFLRQDLRVCNSVFYGRYKIQ